MLATAEAKAKPEAAVVTAAITLANQSITYNWLFYAQPSRQKYDTVYMYPLFVRYR